MAPEPVVAVPGVDILLPVAVPDADVDVPVEVELPPGVITVPDGVTTVPSPDTPVDGRIPDGATVPVGGAVVTGGTVTGGTTMIAGAATRGVTTSLLSTQSGPLRSMHAGIASGMLSLRSVVSAAIADAPTVNSAMNEAAMVFMRCPLIKVISSSPAREKWCTAPGIGCRAGGRGFEHRRAPSSWAWG